MKKIEEWLKVLFIIGLFFYGIWWIVQKLSEPVTKANNTIKENVQSGDFSLIFIILLFYLIVVILEFSLVNKNKKYKRVVEKFNIDEKSLEGYLTNHESKEQKRIIKLGPINRRFSVVYKYLDEHPLFLIIGFYLTFFLYEPIKIYFEK